MNISLIEALEREAKMYTITGRVTADTRRYLLKMLMDWEMMVVVREMVVEKMNRLGIEQSATWISHDLYEKLEHQIGELMKIRDAIDEIAREEHKYAIPSDE